MKQILIGTHYGKFHNDEIMAIALLKIFKYPANHLDFIRIPHANDISEIEDLDKYDYIIDTGKLYDKVKHFDHHQYKGGQSSAGMIWSYIKDTMNIKDTDFMDIEELIYIIDRDDVGDKKAGVAELPNLINLFNTDDIYAPVQEEAFKMALSFTIMIVDKMKHKGLAGQEVISKFEQAERLGEYGNVINIKDRPKHWSNYITGKTFPEVDAVIWYNEDNDTWGIKTITKTNDSYEPNGKTLPEDPIMNFVHKAGFYGVAKDKETMLSYLDKHILNYKGVELRNGWITCETCGSHYPKDYIGECTCDNCSKSVIHTDKVHGLGV